MGIRDGSPPTGEISTGQLGTGTANSSTFLRGDQTWAAPPVIFAALSAGAIAAAFTSGLGNAGGAWENWAICDGGNSTPNLAALFIRASVTGSGATGGSDSSAHTHSVTSNVTVADHSSHTHGYSEIVQHTHTVNVNDPQHNHSQVAHTHVVTSQTATTGSATSYEHGTLDTSSAEAEATEVTGSTQATNVAASTGITATTSDPSGSVANGTTSGPSAALSHSPTNNAVTSGGASVTDNRPAFYELVPLMKVA
jgi:hypothetical protein